MTQLFYIHVNPVVHMNLTDNKKSNIVIVKPISHELLNHDPSTTLGISLPKVKELKVSWIKGMKKTASLKQNLKAYIDNLANPIPVKVNDIIYIPKFDLFKVKAIVFEKDQKDEITKLGLKLPKTIEVSELSYSKYPGYLLDAKCISSIDISSKKISTAIPDLNYIMDHPFNVLHGFPYKFLEELRTYFLPPK